MKDGSVTFGWFVRNRYYQLRDWRPETEKVKKIQIERDLVEKFESVSLDAVEPFALQKHLKHLATCLSEDRVKHARSYMKSIFAEAVEQDFLARDPTRRVKIPRNLAVDSRLARPSTEERFDRLAKRRRALGTFFYPREWSMISGCGSRSAQTLHPMPSFFPTPTVGSWIREITGTE